MGKYRLILFDLDGTLRHNRPSHEHTFFNYAAQLGAKDSPELRRNGMRWAHYYWAQSPLLMRDLEVYKDQEEIFWTNYLMRHLLAFGCTSEQASELVTPVKNLMAENYKPEDILLPGTIETLRELREAGYRIGIVTNRHKPCDEQLADLGLLPYIEKSIVAGAVSSWKPDPRIFEHTLKQFKIAPERAIFVGDNYFADVIGAKRAGIRPVLLDPECVFDDPDCDVISRIEELPSLLN